ncbi:MAG: hypothetical protein DMG80_15875 [Acidobacteria bacterium]|nr:MAG: hypothetical protein DMG80_15875 [Acidobacteriota bacterium]
MAIEFRNCVSQHLTMPGVGRRFQLAGQAAAGEKQPLAFAIAVAFFGRQCRTGRLVPLRHRILLLFD